MQLQRPLNSSRLEHKTWQTIKFLLFVSSVTRKRGRDKVGDLLCVPSLQRVFHLFSSLFCPTFTHYFLLLVSSDYARLARARRQTHYSSLLFSLPPYARWKASWCGVERPGAPGEAGTPSKLREEYIWLGLFFTLVGLQIVKSILIPKFGMLRQGAPPGTIFFILILHVSFLFYPG